MKTPAQFHPYTDLARDLASLLSPVPDGSHDISHIVRVWGFADRIQQVEGGDPLTLFAATFLHDCVHIEKDHRDRHLASRLSAQRAAKALRERGWNENRIAAVCHAIEAHSLTGGIRPRTLEARILSDADRLDSTGMIGIARCFYVAGRIGSMLYDPEDPLADDRPVDDLTFALDHFRTRLLAGVCKFQTATGRKLAEKGLRQITLFRDQFLSEIPVLADFPLASAERIA